MLWTFPAKRAGQLIISYPVTKPHPPWHVLGDSPAPFAILGVRRGGLCDISRQACLVDLGDAAHYILGPPIGGLHPSKGGDEHILKSRELNQRHLSRRPPGKFFWRQYSQSPLLSTHGHMNMSRVLWAAPQECGIITQVANSPRCVENDVKCSCESRCSDQWLGTWRRIPPEPFTV